MAGRGLVTAVKLARNKAAFRSTRYLEGFCQPPSSRSLLFGTGWLLTGNKGRASSRSDGGIKGERRALSLSASSQPNEGAKSCPIAYRTGARRLCSRGDDVEASTAYVIGGMYGNVYALDAVIERASRETVPPLLVFNGDFNFFNVESFDFALINNTIRTHPRALATAGNVEYEIAHSFGKQGCGCGYPRYVDAGVISRSDEIVRMLGQVAQSALHDDTVHWLSSLPLHATLRIGACRVGVVHGDPDSLAGWGFGVEMMEPLDQGLRRGLGVHDAEYTPRERVAAWFQEAHVQAFSCTHTCLAFAQEFAEACAVFNNGSAGIPNFEGRLHGLMTRISADLEPPTDSLYGCILPGHGDSGIRMDAVPVMYEHQAFLAWFERHWAAGSPAHKSYHSRISKGVSGYTVAHANRLKAEQHAT